MMDEWEAERIAAAINALRPDWPRKSIQTLILTKLGHHTRRDICVALAWVACEPNTSTPARVIEAGPWWKAALAESGESRGWRPPKRDQECRDHAGEHVDSCRMCAADRLAGDGKPSRRPAERIRVDTDAARAALRRAER